MMRISAPMMSAAVLSLCLSACATDGMDSMDGDQDASAASTMSDDDADSMDDSASSSMTPPSTSSTPPPQTPPTTPPSSSMTPPSSSMTPPPSTSPSTPPPATPGTATISPGATVRGSDGVLGTLVGSQAGASGQTELVIEGSDGQVRAVSATGASAQGADVVLSITMAQFMAAPTVAAPAGGATPPSTDGT